MPARLRQSAGKVTEAATPSRNYDISGIDFNEALTWRAGKAIAVADLLTRLQKLGTELRALDQGQVAAREFTQLAQDLAHSNLLGHKDKGVRAWVLCCIVDVLNICAPDAPFGPAQLKDIFTVVVNTILPALADPSNAYNAQHVYILNSLTDTKSIVLITDLDNSENLVIPLFTICFDIVSGAGHTASGMELAKSVEFQLRSMLVTIIDEIDLPQEATDIILSQFLRVDPRTSSNEQPSKGRRHTETKDKKQETLHLKDYPPAYNMAKSICTTCPDKMTVHVTQYFGNIIMNASASLESDVDTKTGRKQPDLTDSDDEDESLADLRKAHRLVRELWRACPDVLQNVIPQIEAEVAADAISLRQLATETLGDIIAGIGISGPPPTTDLDPAAYPLPSIEEMEPIPSVTNPLLVPASPKPFGSIHATAFQAFLGRYNDKAASVRVAWAIAVGRILRTDAGGIGIGAEDRHRMLSSYSLIIKDPEEKVRLNAIQVLAHFHYHGVINVLGADGGLSEPDTLLSALAERVTDRRTNVREEAMLTLGRMWGVASRDIESGIAQVVTVLGGIPSRLVGAMYINDLHTHLMLDKVLFESLLPLSFPPVKASKGEGQKQRAKDKPINSQDTASTDADHVRVRRMLTFVRSLDEKAKPVFIGMQQRQADMGKAMKVFLKACEDYNGGVMDSDTERKALEDALKRYTQQLSKQFPESAKASSDLSKFADMHDRRNYQLIRFATGTEYDYRTVTKAIKELIKRLREGPAKSQTLVDTIQPLVYRCALLVYNRSHVPAIMDIARSDQAGLAEVAHNMLKEISAKNPEVLKSHIQALCKELEEQAPSESVAESPSAPDTLKACAGFARKYPADVPKDRKFLSALTSYALFSRSPRAAKHAVTIVLTVSDKKELHAKELMSKAVRDCSHTSKHYLARLATISQVCLIAPNAAASEEKTIIRIAITDCLHQNQSPSDGNEGSAWDATPSDETIAKILALKIMVNRCRSADDKDGVESFDILAKNVLKLLMRAIEEQGEIAPSKDTPLPQKNRLKLAAVHFILKLCSHKRRCEELVSGPMFKAVGLILVYPPLTVRTEIIRKLQKYLGRSGLHPRWYTICFLIAFEPDVKLKNETISWLKSRVLYYSKQQKQATSGNKPVSQTVMETLLARLLSLLAHHPDYPDSKDDNFESDLLDFAKYIVFYLQAVANEDNLSLIFHIAQRVKQTVDNVTGEQEHSERLYVLSDLAQAVIRNYADLMPAHAKGVNLLQTWPGRVTLPTNLFSALPSHTAAHEIAAKNYLPEEVALSLENLVRNVVKGRKGAQPRRSAPERKRKSSESVDLEDNEDTTERRSVKKSKKTSLPIRKTPKSKRKSHDASLSTEQPSRKSARVSTTSAVNYAESDEDEAEDAEMYDAPAPSSPSLRPTAVSKKSAKTAQLDSDPVVEAQTREVITTDDISEANQDDLNGKSHDVDVGHNTNGDNEKENQDVNDAVQDEDNDTEMSEREETPSPLKENQNGKATKSRSKGKSGKAKTTPTQNGKAKPVISKKAPKTAKTKNTTEEAVETTEAAAEPATTRRSTRRAKA